MDRASIIELLERKANDYQSQCGDTKVTTLNLGAPNTMATQTDLCYENLPALTGDRSAAASPQRVGAGPENVAYNDFFQRLLNRQSSGRRSVVPHPVAQSHSTHYYTDPGPPVLRAGRLGAPWRHVKQCTGNLGNHICFIDGTVKQDDTRYYPPIGYVPTPDKFVTLPPKSAPLLARRSLDSVRPSRFNQNAKLGFKYWVEDRKPVPYYGNFALRTPRAYSAKVIIR